MLATKSIVVAVFCLLYFSRPAAAQPKVDGRHLYERLYVVLPLVGKGTMAEPKRPMFAPAPGSINSKSRSGILGFSFQTSDDGRYALVEFIAANRSAFTEIKADTSVKTFQKGTNKREDIEAEFKKYKKDFNFDQVDIPLTQLALTDPYW